MPTYRIEVDENGEVIDCASGQTILHAALRQGFGFPHECSSGSCGACQFQLLSGEIHNLWPDAPGLSERARRKGDRWLACQSMARADARIRVVADPNCRPFVRPDVEPVALTKILDVTHDMREFVFTGHRAAHFLPGQYVLLGVPEVEGARAYSMCNLSNDDGDWHLIIKRKPGGVMTNYLFEQARPGDMFTLAGPYGRAVLQPEMDDVACIAGGSGLSPILSIVRSLLARASRRRPIQLFYGGREARDVTELPLVEKFAAAGDAINFIPAISEGPVSDWKGARGFIHEIAEQRLTAGAGTNVFIAGPPPMIHATLAMLERRGVARDKIHYDSFY